MGDQFLNHCMEDNLQGVNDCLNGFFETLCQGLTVACDRGNPAIVSRLVQVPGLNFNYQDEVEGWTAAHLASKGRHKLKNSLFLL